MIVGQNNSEFQFDLSGFSFCVGLGKPFGYFQFCYSALHIRTRR